MLRTDMRTVFLFPVAPRDDTVRRIERLASPTQAHPWVINSAHRRKDNPAIYVEIATTQDTHAPLYCDWEPAAMQALATAAGSLPDWGVLCNVCGRIPGDEQIRAFVLMLLSDGGVAMDAYSDYCWTAADIVKDQRVDGLAFFDYRTNDRRLQDFGNVGQHQ
jgi:hypothetical protein